MIFHKLMTICLSLALALLLLPPAAGAADTEAANLYDRGQFELSDGNYRDALSYLEQAVELEPEKASYQLAYGQALLHLKRYDEAEKAFQKVLDSGPEAKKAGLVEMAALYARLKDYRRAIDCYSQALELMPERADLYLARGSMYMNLDDYDRARAEYRQAVCVNPKLGPGRPFLRSLASPQTRGPGRRPGQDGRGPGTRARRRSDHPDRKFQGIGGQGATKA